MEERELSLVAVAASMGVALLIVAGVSPAEWTLDLALAPLDIELSASFAGATIELNF